MNWTRRKREDAEVNRESSTRPPDWNLTIADLIEEMKAGKHRSIKELKWAREYEQSLIPEGIRVPRKGDVYESVKDQTVSYLIGWRGPFTTGGEATLLKGERVWINSDATDENPIGTYALPVERERLEERMVPREDRDDPKYGGFYFFLKTVELNENFKLVETGYTGAAADKHR